ncbi:MAG TPA: malate synthase A [Thermomicrobiales bacterium]|jgi:malate synthase|nr:malate synthase A [Thermomicrobiales bacterium]
MANGVMLTADIPEHAAHVFTDEALDFVADLHRTFNARRLELLDLRAQRVARIPTSFGLDFLPETKSVRDGDWRVAPATSGLIDRRVEITGPTDRKMMINALNSGAKVFMADLEDANSPTWQNVVEGQVNLYDAVRHQIRFEQEDGKVYELEPVIATLVVRPRGWHLVERHVEVDGEPASASLVDFGLTFFNNGAEQGLRGLGPYFYLPKLESHLEARLWNDVFVWAQERIGMPQGSIRATVLIETIFAAFEMDEILYELREHAAGLNAGRWDYIFSLIKTFSSSPNHILPDRAQVTMAVPFMKAYSDLLVKTCHQRGAHAIGGMAAFIPTRRDPEANELAFAKVREDKQREANAGFDGTWVAHPGLVPVAEAEFNAVLGDKPNQTDRQRTDVEPTAAALLTTDIAGGQVTEAGLRTNISVAIQYLDNWLRGNGAAAINNLMEDAATAEISRAQIWQWIRHRVRTEDGEPITVERYRALRDEELAKLNNPAGNRYADAATILNLLIESEAFIPFLTIPAYDFLTAEDA